MRDSLFRDMLPLTVTEVIEPFNLEERTFILNERIKEVGKARIERNNRIVAIRKYTRVNRKRTRSAA
ncbi:hypothetical protein LCGC14_3151510 [marine sediment metagenome]|uniref:Uncharacterized protein n=1 Tax=marine sediment metagenome TaxID=412755 RepID=A0A0F8YIC7_9ZZZZ